MMVRRSDWWSQPVAREGSISSEGIRRQLGRPHLDPLTVLVRETAQNTCDASLPHVAHVDFLMQINELSGNKLAAWRDFLLPEPTGSELGIESWFERGKPRLLSIVDRGTTGLGGPLRADEIAEAGERSDFVNFVRNVGQRKETRGGGGSYGFGKGILYNVSRCHVIVVDSVCIYQGRRQRRLIGVALGDGFTSGARRFTGRHWLGIQEGDEFARPFLDEEADSMAELLGLQKFKSGETGTTIVVVDPDLGRPTDSETASEREPDDAARYIASTMLWNLWPRMLKARPQRLVCAVKREGFVQPVPDPESVLELKPYVDAYALLDQEGQYAVPERKSPPRQIGRFAGARSMAPYRTDPLLELAAPYEGRAHHCARMRQADLVVDYVAGPSGTDEMVQFGGVFRSSPEADAFFAEAEPPTHDDWVTNGLQGAARGVVQLGARFVKERLESFVQVKPRDVSGSDAPLAALASRFAGLMGGAPGDAAGASDDEPGTRSGRGGGRSTKPRFIEGPELVREGEIVILRALVQFPNWSGSNVVQAQPRIVLDSGVEPLGLDSPKVLDWTAVDDGTQVKGPQLKVDRSSPREWELRIRPTPNTVIRVELAVLEDGAVS